MPSRKAPRPPLLTERGRIVVVMGVMWMLVGYGVLHNANTELPGPPHFLIPAELRGWTWIVTGAAAVVAAVTQKGKDAAIAGLIIMPAVRVASYTYAWVVALVPGVPDGLADGWYYAALHAVYLILVVSVAHVRPDAMTSQAAHRQLIEHYQTSRKARAAEADTDDPTPEARE